MANKMSYYLFDDERLNLRLIFSEIEVDDFKEMWKAGISLENIAKKMKRKPLEVALLTLDRAEVGEIKRRGTGIFGL